MLYSVNPLKIALLAQFSVFLYDFLTDRCAFSMRIQQLYYRRKRVRTDAATLRILKINHNYHIWKKNGFTRKSV